MSLTSLWIAPKTNPDLGARVFLDAFDSGIDDSGDRADARAHQSDAVEIGLLARTFFGTLTGLIAFVEQLDLLEFFEGFAKQRLGILELHAQFVGRAREVLTALDRSLGIGR